MASVLLDPQRRMSRSPSHRPKAILLAFALHLPITLLAQQPLLPVYDFQRLVVPPSGPWSRIVRDSAGFVWIGRSDGVETYDGYSARHYGHFENDPFSLALGQVYSLLSDSKQRLWLGTSTSCLSLYDRSRDRFLNFPLQVGDSSLYQRNVIRTILEGQSGDLWLATSFGIVRVELPGDTGLGNPDSLARTIRFTEFRPGTQLNAVYDLCERKDGRIIAASDSGLLIFDPLTRSFSRPLFPDGVGRRLNSVSISSLAQDSAGDLWLGTATEGVFFVDWESQKVQNFRHKEGDSLSISYDDIGDIAVDPGGSLWIGTVKAIDQFSPVDSRRISYLTVGPGPPGTDLARLSVDYTGTLWIVSKESAYWLSPRSRLIPRYSLRDLDGTPRGFLTIERDQEGRLWFSTPPMLHMIDVQTLQVLKSIDFFQGKVPTPHVGIITQNYSLVDRRGTYWHGAHSLGLFKVNLATGQATNYRYRPTATGLSQRVTNIAQGMGDSLWIAAEEDGLMSFDPRTEEFATAMAGRSLVINIMRDRQGLVWIAASSDGLLQYDPTTRRTNRFVHADSDSHSLSEGRATCVTQDRSGRIWVGVGSAVNLWEPTSRSFTRYPNPGLADARFCVPVGNDALGRLWIAYPGGMLSILDPTSGYFKNVGPTCGLSGAFNDMETLDDGRIVLAGGCGIHLFSLDKLNIPRSPPPLLITRMAINDQAAFPPLLHEGAGSMRLSHTQNVLEFEFATLDIDAPQLVRYQYQLEGLEKEWVRPKDRRYVRYTSVPPGDYVFRVRASSGYDEWPETEIALAIAIAPPWWRTSWAYTMYGLLLVGSLYAGYRQRLKQVRLKQQTATAHLHAEHLAELDRVKSRFFANISHEFRTPLTLILGPARQLLETSRDEETKTKADLIHRSARKLNRLVDELLDLAKIEAGEMKLSAHPVNVVTAVHDIVRAFAPLAESKKIACHWGYDENEIVAYLDKGKVDKIIANVLSNAFKFTPEGGVIDVQITKSPPPPLAPSHPQDSSAGDLKSGRVGEHVTVTVSDTGIGINKDHLGKIFDRFYQVDGSHTREQGGTGIGLALTKELVELHKGRIEVESEEGKGSTFRLIFPLGKAHLKAEEICREEKEVEPEKVVPQLDVTVASRGKHESVEPGTTSLPSLLMVEDNADVRQYIRSILEKTYRILEAKDGAEGLSKSLECTPDLIVTDVMMPKMDGFQLCSTLKADARTSHIPVIMLTAKATSKDKINGLDIGADDYIMKPFEAPELEARIRNLLEQRRRLHEHFRTHGCVELTEKYITSVDQKFLQKAIEVVNAHIADTSFSVEVFAEEMAMSRSLLFRKMESLAGEPPSELIKRTRLQRAAKLLEAGAGNVSEIALEVGFSNPSHFTESFRKQFGHTPTQYLHNIQNPSSGQALPGPK